MNIRPYQGILPRLGANVYVDPGAHLIGDVDVGDDASLWPGVVARGDVHHIRIGARTNVQDGSILHVTHAGEYTDDGFPLMIGADVTIGHAAVVHACTIRDACLIGMHATVLDGAVVNRHSMIGAGARARFTYSARRLPSPRRQRTASAPSPSTSNRPALPPMPASRGVSFARRTESRSRWSSSQLRCGARPVHSQSSLLRAKVSAAFGSGIFACAAGSGS